MSFNLILFSLWYHALSNEGPKHECSTTVKVYPMGRRLWSMEALFQHKQNFVHCWKSKVKWKMLRWMCSPEHPWGQTPGQVIPACRPASDFRDHEVIKQWVVWGSGYCVQEIQFWMFTWAKSWCNSGDGKVLSNKDPCKEIDKWMSESGNHLLIRHVKAHQRNRMSERRNIPHKSVTQLGGLWFNGLLTMTRLQGLRMKQRLQVTFRHPEVHTWCMKIKTLQWHCRRQWICVGRTLPVMHDLDCFKKLQLISICDLVFPNPFSGKKILFIMPLTSLENSFEGHILTCITDMHQEWSEIQERIK